jgi:hypothetical protein
MSFGSMMKTYPVRFRLTFHNPRMRGYLIGGRGLRWTLEILNANLQPTIRKHVILISSKDSMASLAFSITSSASSILHGVLVCLSRFSDTVLFEAKEDNVRLTFAFQCHMLTGC